jgi:hypothetical protein
MKCRLLALLLAPVVGAAVLLVAVGCDTYQPAGVDKQYVVEAYLRAADTLPPVRLSRTAPVEATYEFNEQAVSNAEVQVRRVDVDDAPPVGYVERADSAGVYRPAELPSRPEGAGVAQPLARYRLTVRPPAGDGIATEEVTAETVVPDTFGIVETSGDTLTWRQDELRATLTQSQYPGRRARFIVATTALAPSRENLTPLAARILDRAEGEEVSVNELAVTESPVINGGNYELSPRGTLTIDIPWLVANFYGPNEIAIRALGDNYYDFVRSQNVQQGGSTFSPGAIPNVIERVEGGTGLFGSYAGATYRLRVTRGDGGGL